MQLTTQANMRRGQTLLTLVLMIGSIIIAAAAVCIALVMASLASTYGYRATQVANATAMAGIEDAMVQLTRDGNFSSAGYTVTSGSFPTTVTVTQSSPSAGYVTALSIATITGTTRKLSALFS